MKAIVSASELSVRASGHAPEPGGQRGQAYARYGAAMGAGAAPAPDFDHAVVRHALIDRARAIPCRGRVIKLG